MRKKKRFSLKAKNVMSGLTGECSHCDYDRVGSGLGLHNPFGKKKMRRG